MKPVRFGGSTAIRVQSSPSCLRQTANAVSLLLLSVHASVTCPARLVCAVRLVGADGAPTAPLPSKATVWGPPGALSLIVRLALRFPTERGVNRRLIVRAAPGASTPPP